MHISKLTVRAIQLSVLLFTLFLAQVSFAATLSLSPATGVYKAGNTFTARVVVNTNRKPVNASEGTLTFSPKELSVVNVSRGSSIFNLWTAEPTFSNTEGTITFGGGLPSGYTGSAGTVMSVTFRAKNAGTARVSFSKGSVLAADGRGTNVLTSMNGATYTLVAQAVQPIPEVIEYIAPPNTPRTPRITSSTHPDASLWYKETTAKLSWEVPPGIIAVRTLLDSNSGSVPTKVYSDPISSIEIPDIEQGVSYFHLQFKNNEGWGRIAHYRLGVDTESPTAITISLADTADLSDPEQVLSVKVEDASSPVSIFKVQLDGGEPADYTDETGSSTILLPALEPGYHTVIIEAFDAAGNSIVGTFSFNILAFDKPQFTDYPSQINSEVIPVIKGITRPNADVTVRIAQVRFTDNAYAAPTEYTVRSDESGVFVFIPDGKLQNGVYELTAVAIDEHGAQSESSDPIRIAVQDPGYIQIGSLIVNALSVIVPLFALLVLLVFGIWYITHRIKRFRRKVAIESKEAHEILKREFSKLHKVLHLQTESLQKSHKTKKLTKAEDAMVEGIDTALQTAQTQIEKEIVDVEQLIKKKK